MELNKPMVIICPECKIKQKGYMEFNQGVPYIKCSFKPCGHIISGHEFVAVTTEIIKWPSDMRLALMHH